MKSLTSRFLGILVSISMMQPGIASPGLPDLSASDFAPAPAGEEILLAANPGFTRMVRTQTTLIRHTATEYQRKVAEQRARAYVAAVRKAQQESKPEKKPTQKPEPEKKPEKKVTQKKGTQPPPEKKVAQEPPPKKVTPETKPEKKVVEKKVAEKKLPRYIAVDVPKDKRSGPEVKKVVMVWDTHAEALVGNNVYDLQNPPAIGKTEVFDTYSAEYVGAGIQR